MRTQIHPLAEAIPATSAEEYQALRDSIAESGLHDAITLYEGKILDGRHRERACHELKVPPRYEEYEGQEPHLLVLARNVARRHLTPSQRAMAAADVLAVFEKEAAARAKAAKRAGGKTAGRGRPKPIGSAPAGAQAKSAPQRATADAARATAATPRSVQRAKRVAQESPEVAEKVRKGEMQLGTAERKIAEQKVAPLLSEGEREWRLRKTKALKQFRDVTLAASVLHHNEGDFVRAAQEEAPGRVCGALVPSAPSTNEPGGASVRGCYAGTRGVCSAVTLRICDPCTVMGGRFVAWGPSGAMLRSQ